MNGLALLILLASPVIARHIIEGPIGEIADATEAVTRLDQEAANPQTTPGRREEVQAARVQQVEQISRVAAANPQSEQVNIAAAGSLLRVNEPVRAEQAAERAVAAAPQNPDTYLLRGRARMERRNYEEAVADFREVLRLRPGDRAAKGFLKLSEGRGATAPTDSTSPKAPNPEPSVSESLRLATKSTGAWTALQEAARARKTQKESTALYDEAIRAFKLGDLDAAIARSEKALAKAPTSAEIGELHRGLLAEKQKAIEKEAAVRIAMAKRNESKSMYHNATSRRRWGHDKYPGEEASAQRHCVVSCILGREHTIMKGRAMGVGNEVQGFLWHDIWQLRSRILGRSAWAFSLQDMRNNERGFACADKSTAISEEENEEYCDKCCSGR